MDTRRVLRACWNLRLASLFVAGPLAGLAVQSLIFGMTTGMQRVALGMAAFSLVLFAILIKGEYARLSRLPHR